MGRGKLYVCMLVLCVCVGGHCAVDWRALPSKWSLSSNHDFRYYSCTRNTCFCLLSLVSSLYPAVEHFLLSITLGRAWKQRQSSSPLSFGPQSQYDGSLASRALGVFSGSIDPSCSMFRGDLVPASILRDSVHSNQVGTNSTEQTIDNCDGTKRVRS